MSAEATDLLLHENYALPSTMMIRRDVLTTVPAFTTELKVCDDILVTYLVARKWSVSLLNFIGAHRRIRGSNISGDPLLSMTDGLTVKRLMRAAEPSARNRETLDRQLRSWEISLTREYANRREFRRSIGHGLGTVTTDCRNLRSSLKALARTFVMAAGLKRTVAGD